MRVNWYCIILLNRPLVFDRAECVCFATTVIVVSEVPCVLGSWKRCHANADQDRGNYATLEDAFAVGGEPKVPSTNVGAGVNYVEAEEDQHPIR